MLKRVTPVLLSALLLAPATFAEPAGPQSPAQAEHERSYTTQWVEGDTTFRSVMFPHEVSGCKMMVQSRTGPISGYIKTLEDEGPDCNCDLMIDGMEVLYKTPGEYAAEKMLNICKGPSVDGTERRLMIMRESLKLKPDFTRLENVEAD